MIEQMNLQPVLEDERVRLVPLTPGDFEALYLVASDPLIWEQHPNRDRYRRDVFQKFFEGALQSRGALLIVDRTTESLIGSSRYYDLNVTQEIVSIGYTFIARSHWGGQFNPRVKRLMIDHAFRFVDRIVFEIGALNRRSQIAIERLGARKIDEKLVTYFGEEPKLNFVYEMDKRHWL